MAIRSGPRQKACPHQCERDVEIANNGSCRVDTPEHGSYDLVYWACGESRHAQHHGPL